MFLGNTFRFLAFSSSWFCCGREREHKATEMSNPEITIRLPLIFIDLGFNHPELIIFSGLLLTDMIGGKNFFGVSGKKIF